MLPSLFFILSSLFLCVICSFSLFFFSPHPFLLPSLFTSPLTFLSYCLPFFPYSCFFFLFLLWKFSCFWHVLLCAGDTEVCGWCNCAGGNPTGGAQAVTYSHQAGALTDNRYTTNIVIIFQIPYRKNCNSQLFSTGTTYFLHNHHCQCSGAGPILTGSGSVKKCIHKVKQKI